MEALCKGNTHGKVLLFTIMFCMLAVSVSAISFIPQGDVDGMGIRKMLNFTNVSADKFCMDNGTCGTVAEFTATGVDTNLGINVTSLNNESGNVGLKNDYLTGIFYLKPIVDDSIAVLNGRVDRNNESLYSINNETAAGRNATVFINQTGSIFGIDISYFTGLFYVKALVDSAISTVADSIGLNITYHNASVVSFVNTEVSALANNTYTVAETNTQLVNLNNSALARETKYNKTKVQQDINDSAIRLNYLDLNGNITMAFGNISSGRNPDGEQGITMRVIKSADYFLGKGGFFNIYNSTGHWIAYIRESDGLINSRRHGQSDNWYQAYLWGDHAVAGYAVNASILNYINSDLKKGNTTTEIQETINDSTAISPTRVEVLTTVYIGGSGQVTRTNYTLSGCVIYENSSAVWTQC